MDIVHESPPKCWQIKFFTREGEAAYRLADLILQPVGICMKHALFFASLAAVLLANPSIAAADHRPVNSVRDWSGFYLGAGIGYDFADIDQSLILENSAFSGSVSSDTDANGATGTVTFGYDKQLFSRFVVGVFADYSFGELDGSGTWVYPDASSIPFSVKYDNLWAIGARVGVITEETLWFLPRDALWYLTAGYTEADLKYSDFSGRVDADLQGYFLGAGVEREVLCDGLFLKLEYRYSDFGRETVFEDTTSGTCGTNCYERDDLDTEIHSVRLGLAYKFGAPREIDYTPMK